jgi:RimJ/RimL family protein N-acetyltransferase
VRPAGSVPGRNDLKRGAARFDPVHDRVVSDRRDDGLEFRLFTRQDASAMVDFLTQSDWPFHGSIAEQATDILQRIADGRYDGQSIRTFWIVQNREHVGVVRLFDLDDETPMFDLRIAAARRGQGLGRQGLAWLTGYIFERYSEVSRIEGTTRQDNAAMRRIFRGCGYAKEAHYRDAWPDAGGGHHDAVGYAILRRDWASGSVTAPNWNDEPNTATDRT